MSFRTPDVDYHVENFAPGYLDSPEPANLPKGATPSAGNCLLTSLGPDGSAKLSKRSGARLVNPACIVAGKRVDGLYEFRREGVGTGQMFAVCNGDTYVWDNATAFTLHSATAFGTNRAIEFLTFRNLCFLMDGTAMKVTNGTTTFDAGFVKPTAAPAIAVVAGPGVTGTYQGLATWYDSVADHDSSPSDQGVATVFANQQRQWTKPTGAPPARVDNWRVWVRRTDTNEQYFKLVATVLVGTATVTEAIVDATRNLASTLLAPLPNANDVPPAFAFGCTAVGYRLGVQSGDSYVWVSALGDPESQHPKDKIGVSRGDGQQLTTLKTIGTTIIAQKGRKTFQLKGDRMPFIPAELNPSLGNHQQASSVSAAGWYWAWDDERGPYKTDLQNQWTSLVDGQISRVFGTVNLNGEIRCCHLKRQTLICWLVATGSSTRLRTMLAYNYLVGAWLPPIYGLEYASITTFQVGDGTVDLFVGDEWGRVYRYFRDDVEGPPSGTLTAAITAATASTVTAAAAAFYTTSQGLKGMPVAVVSPAGEWQFRICSSNTGTQITIDTINGTAWTTTPAAQGWTVVVGPIDWFWRSGLETFGKPLRQKNGGHVYLETRAASPAGATIVVRGRFNDTTAGWTASDNMAIPPGGGWGAGLWGTMLWGINQKQPGRKRISRSFFAAQFELSNRYPNQPVEVETFGFTADWLGRWASGG
jgi:hypothetical protein